jgi:cyclic pyranopterin phosphate synthase
MPIGGEHTDQGVPNPELQKQMEEAYGTPERDRTVHGNGPAVYYRFPGFQGSVGFISAMHGKFCGTCNRLRLTSTGGVKPCLCYGETASVREAVRTGNRKQIREILAGAILDKPDSHCFEKEQDITEKKKMAQIGG